MMYLYLSKTNNAYFNIATEEYLLKNFDGDFAYLYINDPSLIIGKHQNTIAEINVPFVIEKDIKVVRRLSGGGTVYHDQGNLNYCFIKRGKEGFLVDFEKYTQPVLSILQKMGVNASLRGKSDLVIEDKKFSGNAEHVFRNKILHHGTMLFNSQLELLNKSIKVNWDKFTDRAIRSNRSVVTNISNHLDSDISINDFKTMFVSELQSEENMELFELKECDLRNIQQLVNEKYSQWHWNYAYSPKYNLNQRMDSDHGVISVSLSIKKGFIVEANVLLNENVQEDLNTLLINREHNYFVLEELFFKQKFAIPSMELLKALF